MNILTIDFETYYDKDYSLSKMQTDAYVYDKRYETIGVAVKRNDEPTVWWSGTETEIEVFLRGFSIHESAVVCHNTLFDGFILSQRFGIRPKLWLDTLGMAKAIHPYRIKFSLATLAHDLLGSEKGSEVVAAMGKRRVDFSKYDMDRYGYYCINDVELTYRLYKLFEPEFPPLEMKIMDMVIRMFTEPKLVGDIPKLRKLYEDELARKEALLELANIDREVIMSNDKFAQALWEAGVVPPQKISARTGKATYAFAKSDKAFMDLLEHPESEVQNLVAARVGVKTTIAETRALMMLNTAERGPLPVYLNYWGAKTTGRLSGGNKINWQNLPARGVSAGIRHAIKAPDGCKIVVGDSSNIELRVAMACAGELDVLEKLASGVDLYCDFASKLFGRTITKADAKERMLGKIAMLSLQYGAGWVKFQEMVRLQTGETLSELEAKNIVYTYRRTFSRIEDLWNHCQSVILPDIYNGADLKAVDANAWVLSVPNGIAMPGYPGVYYHQLDKEPVSGEWTYMMGAERIKIYGGKMVENLCQYVARNIVMWQTAKLNERYPVALSVHDEAVCVVPDEDVEDCEKYMLNCFQTAPKWCRGMIPLTGETGVGQSYAEAK